MIATLKVSDLLSKLCPVMDDHGNYTAPEQDMNIYIKIGSELSVEGLILAVDTVEITDNDLKEVVITANVAQ